MINITTLPKVGKIYIDFDYGESMTLTKAEALHLYNLLSGGLQELDYQERAEYGQDK